MPICLITLTKGLFCSFVFSANECNSMYLYSRKRDLIFS